MEELTKTQLVLLVLLVSFMTSVVTGIVTVTLIDQAPKPVTQTINRVVEKIVGTGEGSKNNNDPFVVNEKTVVVTQEEKITSIVASVAPAVVSVVATKDVPLLTECFFSPFGDNDMFGRFFPGLKVPSVCEEGTERRQVSAGSGFFVSESGFVATNRHVVADETADYSVILNNGDSLPAQVLARDPFQDIAILKIDGEGFTSLALGDSNTLQIGRTVIAIGNALGEFQNTVSVGVVSGLRRTVNTIGAGTVEELRSLIQTDAAINPGNSGGPLITLDGKAVGINTAVARGAENVGFALPVNILKKDLKMEFFLSITFKLFFKSTQVNKS